MRQVRKKRYDQAVENLGIDSLIRDTPVNPMEINPTKIIDPVTNDVIPYSSFQNTGDNLILKKDTGLMTTPTNTTPEAMAEFQVMSHAFRGMAMRDPYAAVKLYNKDPAILDMLSSARNKYNFPEQYYFANQGQRYRPDHSRCWASASMLGRASA